MTPSSTSVNEGATLTYTIANGTANTTYTYAITGVAAADVTGGSLTGTVTTNSSGAATFDVALVSDLTTEGSETMTVAIGSTSTAVTVADTSIAPVGQAFSLTSARDILTSLTANNDTVTGAYGTVNATDIILDSSSADSDTANLVIADGITVTITNIENVNLDLRGDATAGTSIDIDAINFSNIATLTVDSNYAETKFDIENFMDNGKVVFDSTTTAVVMDMYNAGSTEAADDAATVAFTGGVTASFSKGTTDDVDTVTFNSTGSTENVITLLESEDYISSSTSDKDNTIVTGSQDITLVMSQETTAEGFDGATLTNSLDEGASLIIKLSDDDHAHNTALEAGEIDLDSVEADKFIIDTITQNSVNLKVKSGSTLEVGAVNYVVGDITVTNATAGGTVNWNVKYSDVDAGTDSITFAESGTVNIAATGTAAVDIEENILTSISGVGNSTDVNIATGSYGITIEDINAVGGNVLDAVTVTGTSNFTIEDSAGSGSTMKTLSINTKNVTLEKITTGGTTSITATEAISLQEVDSSAANTSVITINAGTTVALNDGLGETNDTGNISVTAGTTLTTGVAGTLDSDGTITLSSGTTTTIGAAIDAVTSISITSGTTTTLGGAIGGNVGTADVSITATSIDLNSAITATGKTITLTGSSTTVDSTLGAALTASTIVFAGSGHDYDDDAAIDVTGNVTVKTGVDLDLAGSDLDGNLTVEGAGTIVIGELNGNLIASNATGNITISDTGTTNTTSIVSGSGNDSITLNDVEAAISTGGGNDTINGAGVTTTTNQLSINGGAGVDSITGGAATDDILTGGTDTDTFIFLNDDVNSASEKITDFTEGAAGDILSFDSSEMDSLGTDLTSDGVTVTMVDTTDSATTAFVDTHVIVLSGITYADTTAAVNALNGASGMTGNVGTDDNVLVVYADTDGNSYVFEAEGDGSNDFSTTVDVVVQLVGLGITDLAGLTADNFATF